MQPSIDPAWSWMIGSYHIVLIIHGVDAVVPLQHAQPPTVPAGEDTHTHGMILTGMLEHSQFLHRMSERMQMLENNEAQLGCLVGYTDQFIVPIGPTVRLGHFKDNALYKMTSDRMWSLFLNLGTVLPEPSPRLRRRRRSNTVVLAPGVRLRSPSSADRPPRRARTSSMNTASDPPSVPRRRKPVRSRPTITVNIHNPNALLKEISRASSMEQSVQMTMLRAWHTTDEEERELIGISKISV